MKFLKKLFIYSCSGLKTEQEKLISLGLDKIRKITVLTDFTGQILKFSKKKKNIIYSCSMSKTGQEYQISSKSEKN